MFRDQRQTLDPLELELQMFEMPGCGVGAFERQS